jgi:hypothetical protein
LLVVEKVIVWFDLIRYFCSSHYQSSIPVVRVVSLEETLSLLAFFHPICVVCILLCLLVSRTETTNSITRAYHRNDSNRDNREWRTEGESPTVHLAPTRDPSCYGLVITAYLLVC